MHNRITTVILSLVITSLSAFVYGSEVDPKELVTEMKSGKYSDAIPKLQQVDKTSKNYVWSLQESAKSYYKFERWSEFFGVAYFSRKALPVSSETEKIRLLEILALLRHCQMDQAKEVLTMRPYPSDPKIRKHFEVIGELLHIPASVAQNSKPDDKTKKADGVFSSANMWPAQALAIDKLDPHRLRRKVGGVCGKKVAE